VKLMKGEKGFTLIEVVIAIAILGIIAAAFMAGLAGASRALFIADERATAESLARSQMEYIKSQPYSESGTYTRIDLSGFPGYDIPWPPTVDNVTGTTGLQKIDVTVKHLTNNNKLVITLEGYKGDR
jgi:prepilin-type N-terminal cleavage/methylation domain-containing protein